MLDLTLLKTTDIYLLDQIMKGLYRPSEKILDAGCGTGRNLPWFVINKLNIFGIDQDASAIKLVTANLDVDPANFVVGNLDTMPFASASFDHIISSAVLHFAKDQHDFNRLFIEHLRVLKTGGSFFIRMTSDIGIENRIEAQGADTYLIPDGSIRFLLTRHRIDELLSTHHLQLLQPVKTTNVQDLRCMTTLLLRKEI